MRKRIALPIAALLVAASSAHALEPEPRIDFRAERAVLDPGSIDLQGKVQATCGRYGLTADRLRIVSTPGSIDVTGPAVVTLCPCPVAPVSIRFDRATIHPPSDLVLRKPSLRIGGTTVLTLPAAWLRTPDKPGLLAPRIAWRGSDGLLIGPGFHLPWSESDGASAWLDGYLSGYTSAGLELDTALHTSSSESRFRFDHVDGASLVDLRSAGSSGSRAVLSWNADLARGSRSPRGLVELDRAIRPWDHARAEVSSKPWGPFAVATSVEAWGWRGSQLPLSFGPAASLSGDGALGSSGTWQLVATSRWLARPDEPASQITRAVAGAQTGVFAGPIRLGARGRGQASSVVAAHSDGRDLFAIGEASAALPLQRRFGAGDAAWSHGIEPFVAGSAIAADTSGDAFRLASRPAAIGHGTRWIATSGLRTALVRPTGEAAVSADLSAGTIGGFSGEPSSTAALGSVDANARWLALRAEAAAVRDADRKGAVVIGRGRIGKARSSHLLARAAHRDSVDPVTARALIAAEPFAPGISWLDSAGTSAGLDAVVPLFAGYRAHAGADADAGAGRILAWRTGLLYAHPCECLAAAAWVSQRVGRDGVDAWLSLDLVPR